MNIIPSAVGVVNGVHNLDKGYSLHYFSSLYLSQRTHPIWVIKSKIKIKHIVCNNLNSILSLLSQHPLRPSKQIARGNRNSFPIDTLMWSMTACDSEGGTMLELNFLISFALMRVFHSEKSIRNQLSYFSILIK